MRIINAIHSQNIGGVEEVFCNYSKMLNLSDIETIIVISGKSDSNIKEANLKNLNKYNKIFPKNKIFYLRNIAQIFDFTTLLYIIIRYQAKIIICHSKRILKLAKIAKLLCNIKIIAVNHGITIKPSLSADYIININENIANMVVDKGFNPNNNFILHNAIDINKPYYKKYLNDPITIGIYGRIEYRKGFDILIKSLSILQQRGINFKVKIGGFDVPKSDYNWQYLRKMAKDLAVLDNINFVGLVIDKEQFFSDVDIFCVPSREEPFGMVIIESILHSTIVLASNCEGAKIIINHQDNGFIFNNEDVIDLANNITKIAKLSNDHYQAITAKAYQDLQQDFSLNETKKHLINIINKIAN